MRENAPITQDVSTMASPLETRRLSLTLNPSPAGRGKPPVNALGASTLSQHIPLKTAKNKPQVKLKDIKPKQEPKGGASGVVIQKSSSGSSN